MLAKTQITFFFLYFEILHTLDLRFAISIIECEHNRNHMITTWVFFFSFLLDFSVSVSISDAIFGLILTKLCPLVDWIL